MKKTLQSQQDGVNAMLSRVGQLDPAKVAFTLCAVTGPRPYKAMGERIRKARIDKGYDHDGLRDELARLTPGHKKVSFSSISNWETGKSAPQRYMGRLTRVLGVTAEYLEWGDAGAPALAEPEELARAREVAERHGYELVLKEKPSAPRQSPEYSGVNALEPDMVSDRPPPRRVKTSR